MKVAWVVGLMLLAVGIAHSVPAEEELTNHQSMEDALVESVESSIEADDDDDDSDDDKNAAAITDKDAAITDDDSDDDDGDDEAAIADDGDDDQFSEIAAANNKDLIDMAEYQKEINAYLEQDKLHKNDRVKRQNNRGLIRSGNTIALQTFIKDHYLGCAGNPCRRAPCPKAHMTGHDWTRCWGEVFRIYKLGSPGPIRVGDMVGIYYPREFGRWLGCAGHRCGKAPCPGKPNRHYGFSTRSKIRGCWGEVFRIYAKGKRNRAYINSNDEISLYYVRGRLWVSQGYHQTIRTSCLGHSFPPSVSRYDRCAHETFTIWKKVGGC